MTRKLTRNIFHNSSLKNENNESFNFGVKDGVRGFYTDPARADDSFVPFKSDSGITYTKFNNRKSTITIKIQKNGDGIISYNGTFSQHCAGCQKDDPDATATFRRYVWTHSSCGAGQSSGSYCTEHSSSPSSYSHTYNENVCVCGKTEQTIESAELTF